jgi:hypothetical protein
MVPPPGRSDSHVGGPGGLLTAAGRMVGFSIMAGAALAIFAIAVLVPEYARVLQARHELARQEAVNADLKALIEANDRLIAALPENPVLAKRLAMNQFGLLPENEYVVVDARAPRHPPPGTALTKPHPRPEPPNEQLLGITRRLTRPRTRRGLLLLAAAAMLAALFLFPAREKAGRPERTP